MENLRNESRKSENNCDLCDRQMVPSIMVVVCVRTIEIIITVISRGIFYFLS